jgi:hypothetical protein
MRMRATLRSFPARFSGLVAAALYVLLGVSAAWHAPHFSQSETAVHTDRHAGGHEIPSVGDCALCAWKSLSQEDVAFHAPAPSAHDDGSAQHPRTKRPADAPARFASARAPPVLS